MGTAAIVLGIISAIVGVVSAYQTNKQNAAAQADLNDEQINANKESQAREGNYNSMQNQSLQALASGINPQTAVSKASVSGSAPSLGFTPNTDVMTGVANAMALNNSVTDQVVKLISARNETTQTHNAVEDSMFNRMNQERLFNLENLKYMDQKELNEYYKNLEKEKFDFLKYYQEQMLNFKDRELSDAALTRDLNLSIARQRLALDNNRFAFEKEVKKEDRQFQEKVFEHQQSNDVFRHNMENRMLNLDIFKANSANEYNYYNLLTKPGFVGAKLGQYLDKKFNLLKPKKSNYYSY